MNEGNMMAAELLAVSSTAYASCASNRFLEKLPDAKIQFGETAFGHWKDHFRQRIQELSAAMAEKEPSLFLSRVQWSRAAFQAREVPDSLLRESLVCLGEVLEEELPPACNEAPAQYIHAALNSFEDREQKSAELESTDPSSKLAMQYLLNVLEGNSRSAIKLIVDAHENGLSLEQAYLVLMTAQREIGRMWHVAEINIAEEHVVTSTTERAMSILSYAAERAASNGRTVVSAAVAGNSHDIGVRAVSDFFEFAGWRAVCLGGDLPANNIAQAVEFFDCSLVLLSAALSTQLTSIRETVKIVRELDTNCKIMVGGAAFHDAPDLWRQLGADAFAASPSIAVLTARKLIG